MSSTYGTLFKLSTFGESHGGAVGVVIDGCPPGLALREDDIQSQLDRRRPGQSSITTQRKETDTITIYSGVFQGRTTGTPIMLMAHNKDMRPQDYDELSKVFRPGHADFTYLKKYGIRDARGSGRASARETLARVATGAIARKWLHQEYGIEFVAYVEQVHDIEAHINPERVTPEQIEANIVRCPDETAAKKMIERIESIRDQGDSVGGVVRGLIKGLPAGIGEPVFDKLPAELGKVMMSINAVKGFDIGSGFSAVTMKGSEHNDVFVANESGVKTETNYAGGTLGGISTGNDISFRVAFKPVSTISKEQDTVTSDGKNTKLSAGGRHDPCVVPRAVSIVESMAAIVIMDLVLRQAAYQSNEISHE